MATSTAASIDSAQASKVIVDSVKRFKATITPDHERQMEKTTVKDVVDALQVIQQRLVNRRENRNLRKLYPFIKGLEHYSGAIDVLSNGLSPYLPFIWAPVKLMLQISSDYLDAFEKLIEAYDRIGETLPRLAKLGEALKDSPSLLSKLAIYYADVLEFHRRAYKFFTRRSWKFFFMTTWASFDTRFDSILTKMAQSRDSIDREAITIDIVESKKWREDLDFQVDLKEKERTSRQRVSLIAWIGLESRSQDDYCHVLLRDCLPGSCDWVLEHEKIVPWLQTDSKAPVIWIHGKPGAGKSVICASLIESLQDKGMKPIYYFCRYHQSDTSSNILKALVLQLVDRNSDMIAVAYTDYVEKYREPTLKVLRGMLAGTADKPGLLAGVSPCRIILDGVDECEPKEQRYIIEDILQLVSVNTPTKNCKLLVCSRDMPDIARAIQKKTKFSGTIPLSGENPSLNSTVGNLAKARLSSIVEDRPSFQLSDKHVSELCEVIIDRADGMVLWAKLVLESLADIDTLRELHKAITSMPRELSELYKQIITIICDQKKTKVADRVKRILGWLVYAKRPLKKHELLRGVALTPEFPVLDKWDILDGSAIDRCKPLIEYLPDGSIGLIHFTAEEYLRTWCELDPTTSKPFEHSLALSCSLSLSDGLDLIDPDIHEEARLSAIVTGSHDLLGYSVNFWLDHLLRYKADDYISPHEPFGASLAALEQRHQTLWSKMKGGSRWTEESYHTPITDCRLSALSAVPVLPLCATLLAFRETLKESTASDGEEFERLAVEEDPTLFTSLSAQFHLFIAHLLKQSQVRYVTGEQLALFKERYSQCSYRCRFSPCTNTSSGFPSEDLRTAHEKVHIGRLFCVDPSCSRGRVGFRNQRSLEAHNKTYHDEGGILVPPRVRNAGLRVNQLPQLRAEPSRSTISSGLAPQVSNAVRLQKLSKLSLPFGETMTEEIRKSLPMNEEAEPVVIFNEDVESVLDFDHLLTVDVLREIWCIDFSPDGNLVAIGGEEFAAIFGASTGEELYVLDFDEGCTVDEICFNPDGKLLAMTATSDRLLRVWDYKSLSTENVRVGVGHEGEIFNICYAPNGKFIATSGQDKTLRLWCEEKSSNTMTTILVVSAEYELRNIAVTPDSRHLITTSADNSCRIYSVHSVILVRLIENYKAGRLVISKDGHFLASTNYDKTIRLDNIEGFERDGYEPPDPVVLRYHSNDVWDVAFSPTGRQLFSCSKERTLICWDVATRRPHATLGFGGPVDIVCTARDRNIIAVQVGGRFHVCGYKESHRAPRYHRLRQKAQPPILTVRSPN